MSKSKTERTWTISDIDGSNVRNITLAQYRAELDAAKAKAMIAARKMYGDRFIDGIVAGRREAGK
jgi:hypothetical protein